jgi:hypothetical protein
MRQKVCVRCGSGNCLVGAWVNPNTPGVVVGYDDSDAGDGEGGGPGGITAYCCECRNNTTLREGDRPAAAQQGFTAQDLRDLFEDAAEEKALARVLEWQEALVAAAREGRSSSRLRIDKPHDERAAGILQSRGFHVSRSAEEGDGPTSPAYDFYEVSWKEAP